MSMPRGLARIGFAVLLFVAAVAPACGNEHFFIERIGSKAGAGSVKWCDVKQVLSQRCWRCHHKDPENSAPFELCLYSDTQQPYAPGFSNLLVWQEMQDVVSRDFMPPVALFPDLKPPVQPLDASQKDTLRAWFSEGAPSGAGGAGRAGGGGAGGMGRGGASAAVEPPCTGTVDALQAMCLSGKKYADWNTASAGGAGGAIGTAGAGGRSAAGAGGASGTASATAGSGGK